MDDITWCVDAGCPIVNCIRNQKNMKNRDTDHSFAEFRESEECPIYRMEENARIEREGADR